MKHLSVKKAQIGFGLRLGHWMAVTAVACALSAAGTSRGAQTFASFSELKPEPGYKNPLIFLDGAEAKTVRDWVPKRRPELKELFQHYMYGYLPPKPKEMKSKVEGEDADFLGGKATLKRVSLKMGEGDAPQIDLLMVVPNKREGRVPVFLAMNFCGNHAITADKRVPLTRGWLYKSCSGTVDGKATEACRGSQAADWPLEEIVDRGYALATFCSTDVDSDRGDVSDGVYAWLAKVEDPEGERVKGTGAGLVQSRGTISAWAWGFHRCVDYLVKDSAVDPRRIAAVGHSRNGKTALLAAAMDERIALAIPHQAGCGGTAPSRGKIGESVKQINDRFPHWFNAQYKQFNDAPEKLPFDQHCLIALVAPRPVLLSNAVEDQWANPAGQFEVLRAAAPAYRLYVKSGGIPESEVLESNEAPEVGKLMKSRLGYYIRPGKHSMTAGDWRVFMDYAEPYFRIKKWPARRN